MFQEDIRRAIEADDRGFGKFGRGHGSFPGPCRLGSAVTSTSSRFDIPCPAQLSKTTHPTAQRQEAVPEEDAALDAMGQAVEDIVSTLIMES